MAQIFFANYPVSGSAGGSNPSVAPTGTTAPTDATEIGFIDDSTGFLAPFSGPTAASGPNVVVTSSALPTGGATAANQVTQEATLTAIQANQTNGTQVVTQSSGANLHVDVDASALPTGAATSALQITGNTSLASILANQTNGTQETSIVGTVPLPTGAATAANQTTQETTLTAIQANQTNGTQVTSVNNFPATQPVSGTVAVTQSTSPWVVSGSVTVTPSVNTNGSAANSTTVGSGSATTFSPPTNAVGFVVEAESSNTVNLRYACGTTATTTVGMLLEPGRDSGYIPSKGTVTVIAVSGSAQAAGIQWVLSS